MENPDANIDKLFIQLNVLDSKIKRLEEITGGIVKDVESAYQRRINNLTKKKEDAQQLLFKMKEVENNG
jgi:uncharacterized protein YdcH (DUF465 family)